MKNVIVKTQALKKYYQTGNQTVRALDGVDFEVAEREFVSIVGKSGSGKSTLLHMIGGLDTPSSGTVIVDGLNLETLNSEQLALFRRRKVGFIFQQYNLIPDLNVYDNIIFPLELDGTQIDKDFIQELLETLNISDKQEMLPAMLSGGEQQRVAIIRALATKPAIILADEPTGNLDTSTSHDVIGLLKMLSRQYQQTLIVITHDNDIAQMADRIVQIEDGKISMLTSHVFPTQRHHKLFDDVESLFTTCSLRMLKFPLSFLNCPLWLVIIPDFRVPFFLHIADLILLICYRIVLSIYEVSPRFQLSSNQSSSYS